MLPKIIFKYSYVYDQNWQIWLQAYNKSPRKLSYKKVRNYIKIMEQFWKKYEKNILRELSKITNLKWKEKKIICYVVGDCRAFSDPLTLPVCKDKSLFIDILTHELIHQLFTQESNYENARKAWKYIYNKYKKESRLTNVHIPLSAIHWHVYTKLFNEKRLHRDIDRSSFRSDYKKAWEIVKKDGYVNIIEAFSSRIIKR
ncbi:MAG: hypothetical protein CO141_03890 [Candidatus Moranbacteria bacterium CG_4_9_14_3_um_filter_42_9]|nr:MAG: hypothetical protein CO141_03890 [Candidatus Moranbacteria bacterium CG_4_9_14_3_um_filter_42_9]